MLRSGPTMKVVTVGDRVHDAWISVTLKRLVLSPTCRDGDFHNSHQAFKGFARDLEVYGEAPTRSS